MPVCQILKLGCYCKLFLGHNTSRSLPRNAANIRGRPGVRLKKRGVKMESERKLVEYICTSSFEDIPPEPLGVVKNMVLTVLGTTIAGAKAEGCEPLVNFYRGLGGAAEATILNYGGKIPAENAALVNGVMARALDFCDAVEPGLHIGSRCCYEVNHGHIAFQKITCPSDSL